MKPRGCNRLAKLENEQACVHVQLSNDVRMIRAQTNIFIQPFTHAATKVDNIMNNSEILRNKSAYY